MARELRNTGEAHQAMSATRIGPLRRTPPVRPPRAPVVRPLFIPERTPWLPQSNAGWWICVAIFLFGDVAPIVFLVWQLWGR